MSYLLDDHDPTDPDTVPPDLRRQALDAALGAVEKLLDERGRRLDFLARCELLDMALRELAGGLEAGDGPAD